jgi:hypothetical protein
MEFEYILINGYRLYPKNEYFLVYEFLYNSVRKCFGWVNTDEISEILDIYKHQKSHENQISDKLWNNAIYD